MGDNNHGKELNNDDNVDVVESLLEVIDIDKETSKDDKTKLESSVRCYLIFKTLVLIGVWISMGMRVFIEFSTLPNLRLRLDTDIAGLSYAMSFGTFGGFLASPLAACGDRFGNQTDLILSLMLIVAAVVNAMKPYMTSLIWFAICDFLVEMPFALICPIGDSLIVSMWGEKAGPPIHALHAGFTVGLLAGPLIASAFIHSVPSDSTVDESVYNSTDCGNSTIGSNSNEQSCEGNGFNIEDESNIEYAYMICSILMVCMAVIFFIMQFVKVSHHEKTSDKKSYKWKDIVKPSSWAGGNVSKGVLVFIAMNIFYAFHLGAMKGPGMLITTYAVDNPHLNFTGSEAATLTTAMGIGGVVARCVLIIASGFISINILLIITIHAQLIASILLLIFGTRSKLYLWIFSIFFGLATKPIWGVGYQWANEYIILMALHFAVSRMFVGVVDIGQNAMQGYFYSNVSQDSIFYISAVYAILNCLALYAMLLIGSRFETRYVTKKPKEETSDNNTL